VIVLVTPALLAAGFLTEPWLSGFDRPYSRPAIYGSLAGMVLLALSCWPGAARGKRQSSADEPSAHEEWEESVRA
jgi:hypothetical protein